MGVPRRIVTSVPKNVTYEYAQIAAATSFGGAFGEVVRQLEKSLGTKLSRETLADLLAGEFDAARTLEEANINSWLKGGRPLRIEDARAVARAFRVPEGYFTRFYKTATPLYGKS